MRDDDLPPDMMPEDAGGDWVEVVCPYCGEAVEIQLDPETLGDMVQDCEVCCRPWQLRVERDPEGRVHVTADVL